MDALTAEVASLAKESKTETAQKAILERKARLTSSALRRKRSRRAASILEEFRSTLPAPLVGKPLSREEEDEILGYGPEGICGF